MRSALFGILCVPLMPLAAVIFALVLIWLFGDLDAQLMGVLRACVLAETICTGGVLLLRKSVEEGR